MINHFILFVLSFLSLSFFWGNNKRASRGYNYEVFSIKAEQRYYTGSYRTIKEEAILMARRRCGKIRYSLNEKTIKIHHMTEIETINEMDRNGYNHRFLVADVDLEFYCIRKRK